MLAHARRHLTRISGEISHKDALPLIHEIKEEPEHGDLVLEVPSNTQSIAPTTLARSDDQLTTRLRSPSAKRQTWRRSHFRCVAILLAVISRAGSDRGARAQKRS
jgi:hypothetical protein